MTILVASVKGEPFEVDVRPSDDISMLKHTIVERLQLVTPSLHVDRLKIIYEGKIVEDDRCTLEMLGMVPGAFVVFMQTRRSAAAASPETKAASSSCQIGGAKHTMASKDMETDSAIVHSKLDAADQKVLPTATVDKECTTCSSPAQPSGVQISDDRFYALYEELFGSPDFPPLAKALYNEPALIETVVQSFYGSHQELAEAIDSNRDRFLELLTADYNKALQAACLDIPLVFVDPEHSEALKEHFPDKLLMPEDMDALERLSRLGFSAEAAAKAYLKSEREEALAASMLFEDLSLSGNPRTRELAQAASLWWRCQHVGEEFIADRVQLPAEVESLPACIQDLWRDPLFDSFAMTVRQQPELLETMVCTLKCTHPEVANAIASNSTKFVSILEEVYGDGKARYCGESSRAGAHTSQEDGVKEELHPDAIQLSELDAAAITRLSRLGFQWEAALQAFMSSGRNEELAAGLLFQDSVGEVD